MSVMCPECGGRELVVEIRQRAYLTFDADGNHQVRDISGDVEWDNDSVTLCPQCDYTDNFEEFEK